MIWAPFFFVNLIPEQLIVVLFWKQCLWPSVYGFLMKHTCLTDVLADLHSSIFCTLHMDSLLQSLYSSMICYLIILTSLDAV